MQPGLPVLQVCLAQKEEPKCAHVFSTKIFGFGFFVSDVIKFKMELTADV